MIFSKIDPKKSAKNRQNGDFWAKTDSFLGGPISGPPLHLGNHNFFYRAFSDMKKKKKNDQQ